MISLNSANMQCITTLTTGVMFTKHLPHSCIPQNVIRKMQMNLDGIFNLFIIILYRTLAYCFLIAFCFAILFLFRIIICVAESGTIALDEYVRLLGARGLKTASQMEDELEDALRVFDTLGDGFLVANDLREMMRTQGEPVDGDDVSEFMKVATVDADGRMYYMGQCRIFTKSRSSPVWLADKLCHFESYLSY